MLENAKAMKHISHSEAEVQFNMNVILKNYAFDCF